MATALATRTPHKITPLDGQPDVFDFPRDVQPILDRHCVACHNPGSREGGIDLCGDHTPKFSVSYWTIYRHRLVSDGWNLPKSNYPPRGIGTSASPLMQYLKREHYDVHLSDQERDTIRWWIESSAVYPGTYAALGTGMVNARPYAPQMNRRCRSCHGAEVYNKKLRKNVPAWRFGTPTDIERSSTNINALLNLTRPDKSILLVAPSSAVGGRIATVWRSCLPRQERSTLPFPARETQSCTAATFGNQAFRYARVSSQR